MSAITPRQQAVLERFENGLGAREIADQLGISRNAVYQQLQRLRRMGALPHDFTPTGQPVREARREPGADLLRHLTSSNGATGDETIEALSQAGALALAQELRRVRDELDSITRRISLIVPR